MKSKLSVIAILLSLVCFLSSCARGEERPALSTAADTEEEQTRSPALLTEGEDRGQGYLDGFIFFGESTTYHLKNRGVLRGGRDTLQVWGPDSGTVNLSPAIASQKIRYPDTGELLTVAEAAARKKPDYLVLTFGLNGAVQNVRRGKDYYQSCYRLLLEAIRDASPDTRLLLQSCFPVAKNMDVTNYSVTARQLNELIDTLNGWVLELAEEEGIPYLNTAEALKDEEGWLRDELQSGDGHHLTRDAYLEILHYIRTHGYP